MREAAAVPPLLLSLLLGLPPGAGAALPLGGGAPGSPVPQRPASTEDMVTYSFMGAVAVCSLADGGVAELPRSLPSVGTMITEVLLLRHGGQVAGSGIPRPSREQLLSGSIASTVMLVKDLCYEELNAVSRREVDRVLGLLCREARRQPDPATPLPAFCR